MPQLFGDPTEHLGYSEMDSGRSGSPGTCSCCCDCLVPVRCVIDQHEVEIIPASARTSTSNEYTTRGGSSLDSTSRTAYGSSSYRNQQHQQLSQRAAAVVSSRTSGLFYSAHRDLSSLGQAQEAVSYRSAAPSELFGDSLQVSWDSKAPRVPLINLRKIQQHGSNLPCSPVDSERLAAVSQPDGFIRKEGGKCASGHLAINDGRTVALDPPRSETVIWEQQTPSEVLSDPHQDTEVVSLASSNSASLCEPSESLGITSVEKEEGSDICSRNISSSGDSRKLEAAVQEGDTALDIHYFALVAAKRLARFRPWPWLSSGVGTAATGPSHGGMSDNNGKTIANEYLATTFDVNYAVDTFPFIGMDLPCCKAKGTARRNRGGLEAVTAGATGARERASTAYD